MGLKWKSLVRVVLAVGALLSVAGPVAPAQADHAWGTYHWARTTSTFTLNLGDNVSGSWDAALSGASVDWSASTVLDTTVVAGGSNTKRCSATAGRVEVCNSTYGRNGWLGVASIWASGSHITQGTVKLNDTYFNQPPYNTAAWRNFVMCQEVGHTFGLDHQDEVFTNPNLGSCMDYTNDPTSNQHPNAHDFQQLATIYAHLDSTSTGGSSVANTGAASAAGHRQDDWGRALRYSPDGRPILFELDLGNGEKVFTWVTWARGRAGH